MVCGSFRKDGNIARPAHALVTLRAVGGNVDKIGVLPPNRILIEAVQLFIGAGEFADSLAVGGQNKAFKFCNLRLARDGYLCIAKSHKGKSG